LQPHGQVWVENRCVVGPSIAAADQKHIGEIATEEMKVILTGEDRGTITLNAILSSPLYSSF
jgi:hypothetical protein